ncbi:MAG: transcriptional repressor LexA [Bryobacter sp.]|nr:transcriptional repressor LexA [Bryobacter sp.]
MALTRRQKDLLDFLASFIEDKGYSPSYEEIAAGMQLTSLATVHKHIQSLESKGYLKRGFNQSRSLEIAPKYLEERRNYNSVPSSPYEVPLLGRIAAGLPVESVPNPEILAFKDFTGSGNTYALQVRGDSMIEDHICSGDFVLIEKVDSVRDGDIVVALVEGAETTLKRFYKENDGMVRLQPANSTMQPIMVPQASLDIQGRVLAVLRKY